MDVSIARAAALAGLVLLAIPRGLTADPAADRYAVAAGHYSQGRWQLALDEFRALLAEHPGDAKAEQARFYAGESLLQMRKFAAAAAEFRQLLSAQPSQDLARKALFRAGEASYFDGDLGAARRDLEQFQEQYPLDRLNAYVFCYLGDVRLEQGDAAAAETLLVRGLERYPQGPLADECRFNLARAKDQLGQREEAQRMFLALASKPASDWADDAQYRLGGSQLAAGEHAAAAAAFAAFDTTFAASPWKRHAELGRAQALFHLGKHVEASALFERLTSDEGLALEARYWLGLALQARGEPARAADVLLAAAEAAEQAAHPLAPAMVLRAGEALLEAGSAAEAGRQFARLRKAWPTSDLADDALAGQARAALAAADHSAVDALAAEFRRQYVSSELAPTVEQTRARSLLERGEFAAAEKLLAPLAGGAEPPAPASAILLGMALQGQSRHEDVLKAIAAALASRNPRELAAARRLQATALVGLGRFGEAVEPLEAWLEAHGDEAGAAQARAQLALCHARAGRFDASRAAYAALAENHPHDEVLPATCAALAETALAAGHQDWAEELFAALAADGQPPAVAVKGLAGLAWCRFQTGRLDESSAAWQQLLDRFPADPLAAEAALMKGQILEQQQQPEAALALYRQVINRKPPNPRLSAALLGAARIEDRLQRHETAAQLYARLLQEFPELPERDMALYNRGWVLRALGQLQESDQDFAELHARHAASRYWPDAVYRLAERALQTGDRQRAARLLEELLSKEPTGEIRAHALYLAAQVAIAGGAWDEAARPLEQLAEEFPESPLRAMADFWRAEAAYRQGHQADAAARFAALAAQEGDHGQAWRAMVPLRQAQLLAQQKKWPEAAHLAAGIATQYPEFDHQYEADYVLGRCLAAQGKFDEARDCYRRAIRSPQGAKTETAAMAQWMIGESYFHQKNYEAAVREFLRLEILYAFPKWQAAALLEAGKCHEFLGEWPQAVELYARLLKNYPGEPFAEDASQRLQSARARGGK